MNHVRILIWAFFFCILSGCRKEEPLSGSPPESAHRTVLVYLGVYNNFRGEAEKKIRQLKDAWHKDIDGNLLVYADAGEEPVLVHIYHSPQRGNVADTIESYLPENSASPAVFSRVLHTVKDYRPASSYGLAVLSHGTGWLPANMSAPSVSLKSIIVDTATDEPDNYMELAAFAEAIPFKLDFIIFDACWMGSVEVGYELKDKAEYIVASPAEVLEPGFAYSSMMQHLFRPQPDLKAVARDFYEYYDRQNDLFRSATVSVVKTSELDALVPVVREITGGINLLPEDLDAIQTFGYGKQKIYFDLGDYLQKVAPEKQEIIQAALDQCVLYKACTPSYYSAGTGRLNAIRAFSGLSVYIPQETYIEANRAYGALKWSNALLKY